MAHTISRDALTPEAFEVGFKWMMHQRWEVHRELLRAEGLDPDWIGAHEVEPVCCGSCGEQIPWAVIKGWKD